MDMTEANTLREVEGTTVGIYVARETPSNDYSDVGVILEGVVVLHDLENVALAAAMLFGLMYGLNMNYPLKLRYTLEVIQKVIMELDASDLSRKAQHLKRKMQE
ncbi:Potassium transporter 7 [Dissostichus eleginoides]|uniref:Potassium transporter 7 n=1 Tax=Dissostichus eleginoides TaxID=100907 RepID=A0AAD9CMH6_DISEL|nr:Potassium transporter 7 [Dissostichus eleginoides]